MRIAPWFKHNPRNVVSLAFALVVLPTGTLLTGGLPTGALPHEQVDAFLADTLVKPEFGGRVFCTSDVLGTRQQGQVFGGDVREYVYAYCQEYYPKAGHLELGTGESVPVVIMARRTGAGYSLVGYQVPHDGGGGLEIFPPLIRWRIAAAEHSSGPAAPSAQASAYFQL